VEGRGWESKKVFFVWLKLKIETKWEKEICFKNKNWGNTFMIIFKKFQQIIFFICMIYPVTERKNLIDLPFLDQGFILCYLKRCIYTQKFYLFIVTSFFLLLLVLLLCLLKIVYYCLKVFALALGEKGVFYPYKKISMLYFCNWKKNALWNRIFVLGKKCPFMTNNKNLGKRGKNQNHTCTIHRNTTNSFIPLCSNIQWWRLFFAEIFWK
jgi:hypothetical protein